MAVARGSWRCATGAMWWPLLRGVLVVLRGGAGLPESGGAGSGWCDRGSGAQWLRGSGLYKLLLCTTATAPCTACVMHLQDIFLEKHSVKLGFMSACVPLLYCCSCTACVLLFMLLQDIFLEKHGVKLGFMSAFVKAAASALEEVPAVNGVIDGSEIIYRCGLSPLQTVRIHGVCRVSR